MKLSALFAVLALHAQAVEISVADLEGAAHRPLADARQAATVLFFVLHDCPIANGYAPEISRIADEYGKRLVRTYVIYGEALREPATGLAARGSSGIVAGMSTLAEIEKPSRRCRLGNGGKSAAGWTATRRSRRIAPGARFNDGLPTRR